MMALNLSIQLSATSPYNSPPSADLKMQKHSPMRTFRQNENCLPETHPPIPIPTSTNHTPILQSQAYLHGPKWQSPPILRSQHLPLECLERNRTTLRRRKAYTMGMDMGTTTIIATAGRRRRSSSLPNPTCYRCDVAPEVL